MNALRFILLGVSSGLLILTLVWFIMWLSGAMSGFVPLFSFLGLIGTATGFLTTFASKKGI